jgi:ribosomal protein S18 acetylase RimI-like enzyme
LLNRQQFERSFFLVAVNGADNRIFGCAGVIPVSAKTADPCTELDLFGEEWELTGVTVALSYRQRRLARTMIEQLLQDLINGKMRHHAGGISDVVCRRVYPVTLKERMTSACRLYESLGFQLEREEEVYRYSAPPMTVRHYAIHLENPSSIH